MDFTTWLSDRGGKVHPELDLFHTLPSGDRGVVARRDISEGELLLLLPTNCAIYPPTDEEFNRCAALHPCPLQCSFDFWAAAASRQAKCASVHKLIMK